MGYIAKTVRELRTETGTLLAKIASQFSTIQGYINNPGGVAGDPLIKLGTGSSTVPGSGVIVNNTYKRAMVVNCDDGNVPRSQGDLVSCAQFRLMLYADGVAEHFPLHGLLKADSAVLGGCSAGILGAMEAATGLTLAGVAQNIVAGVEGRVGFACAPLYSQAADRIACLLAFGNNQATYTPTGDGKYVGVLVAQVIQGTPQDFDYGVEIYDGVAVTGVRIGSCTTGININSTVTTGIDFTDTVLALDSNRTNSAIAIGDRLGAKTITMAAAVNHLDPIQMNLDIAGVNPTAGSTINGIYQKITHNKTDMTSLRLKCSDWNVIVSKNIKDAYCMQGEVDFTTNAVAVGGESAVLGLVMNAGTIGVTGNLRGLIISMEGRAMPANGIGIELRSTAGVGLGSGLEEGIRISGTPLIQVGIAMGNQTNNNEGPQCAFFFPSPAGADIGPCVNTVDDGNGEGSIKIKIGAVTKYLKYWTDPAA